MEGRQSPYRHQELYKELYLQCVNCGKVTSFDSVSPEDEDPKCSACSGTLGLKSQKHTSSKTKVKSEVKDRRIRLKQYFQKHKGVDILETDEGLDVLISHFHTHSKGTSYFLLFFTFVWFSILMVFPFSWMLSFHFLGGLAVLLTAASRFLNKTSIRIDHRNIEISKGPISLQKSKLIDVDRIDQAFVKRKVNMSSDNGSVTYTYELRLKEKGSYSSETIYSSEDANCCFYLEQEIENYLDIDDEYVQGEHML